MAVALATRVLGITRLVLVGAVSVALLVYRPPGYIAILIAMLAAFVVFPFTVTAILRSRLRKQRNG